jgi:hypothetical protein
MESVIAEKFEAMIVLDTANSRMKDFYDVYKILTEQTVSEMSLHHAITQTFQTRQTVLPDKPAFFPKNFQKTQEIVICGRLSSGGLIQLKSHLLLY